MSLNVELPRGTVRRLEAEAARRGVSIDVVIAELAEALPDDEPAETPVRRRLAVAGIGASGGDRFARDADELLAEGFGRSD